MLNIYHITTTRESKDSFVAEAQGLEGAWAEGNTEKKAVENCKDAIAGILEYNLKLK